MHVLHQARAAVVGALNGLALTGPNVFVQEFHPWPEQSLPCLVVATSSAPERQYLDGSLALRWDVVVTVTAVVKGTGDLAALLDDIATEVQAALCALDSVGGKPVEVVPVSFDLPQPAGEGDQPVMRRSMTFNLQSLYTLAASPDALLD